MKKTASVIGANIKSFREKKFTQAVFASKCGLSLSYIALIEIGKKLPSIDVLERMAQVLDVKIVDLVKGL